MDVSSLRIRLQCMDAVEIESLCLDHFPDVYAKFSRGLRRDEMIILLLDRCRRKDELDRLTRLLQLPSTGAISPDHLAAYLDAVR